MNVPYANATTGTAARDQIMRLLQRFGCSRIGFMDDFKDKSLILAFEWNGRKVQFTANAKGWAKLYLLENPWHKRRRSTPQEWEEKAVAQGMISVNSILRDWVKGQVVAVESGLMRFDHVFFPYMLTDSGETVIDRYLSDVPLLAAPETDAKEE